MRALRWAHRDRIEVGGEQSTTVLGDAAGRPVAVESLGRDFGQDKTAEERTRHHNRCLNTVLAIGRVVAQADCRETLLEGVCRTLLEEGLVSRAWVGLVADGDSGALRPLAHAGFPPGRLHADWFNPGGGAPEVEPTARALRDGQPVVVGLRS